jgi:hypothetical protein
MVIVLAGITGDASSLFYVEWGRIFRYASGLWNDASDCMLVALFLVPNLIFRGRGNNILAM